MRPYKALLIDIVSPDALDEFIVEHVDADELFHYTQVEQVGAVVFTAEALQAVIEAKERFPFAKYFFINSENDFNALSEAINTVKIHGTDSAFTPKLSDKIYKEILNTRTELEKQEFRNESAANS